MPRAIDMHVHPGTREYVVDAGGQFHRHAFTYLRSDVEAVSAAAMADLYRRLDIMAVVFGNIKALMGLATSTAVLASRQGGFMNPHRVVVYSTPT